MDLTPRIASSRERFRNVLQSSLLASSLKRVTRFILACLTQIRQGGVGRVSDRRDKGVFRVLTGLLEIVDKEMAIESGLGGGNVVNMLVLTRLSHVV